MKKIKKIYSKISVIIFIVIFIILYIAVGKLGETNRYYGLLVFKRTDVDFGYMLVSSIISQYVHLDFFHMITNSIFLYWLSKETCKYWLPIKNIFISVVATVFLALCLCLYAKENIVYIGASGWIGAILGATCVEALKENRFTLSHKNVELFCTSLLFLAMALIIPIVSILMHFAGFWFGVVIELVFGYKFNAKEQKGGRRFVP